MRTVISKVPLLAVPLAFAEYVHTGTGALEQLLNFHAHPFLSVAASTSFAIVLIISGFCLWVYLSRLCLWILKQLERGNTALQSFVRQIVLDLLKRAVTRLEKGLPRETGDTV